LRLATDPRTPGREVEQRYIDILGRVKDAVTVPVAVKLGRHFSSVGEIALRLDQAGADVVMTASALIRHRPGHVAVLLDGLAAWMARKGYASVGDLRGVLAVPAGTDQAAYQGQATSARCELPTVAHRPLVTRRDFARNRRDLLRPWRRIQRDGDDNGKSFATSRRAHDRYRSESGARRRV
jgi:hypothetical protein